jgi:hypothetical protein
MTVSAVSPVPQRNRITDESLSARHLMIVTRCKKEEMKSRYEMLYDNSNMIRSRV